MIRIGLIGCGGMGNTHRAAIQQLRDRAQFTAAVDLDLQRARDTANILGCHTAATDYRQVLDEIDAAIVAVPHHLHHPIGLDLLHHSKHLLMEKPLANSEAECLDLIQAAQENNVTLMVAYCMRFHPIVVEMERLLKAETYGDLFQLSIWTEQHTQGEPGSWMHRVETLGGGQLFSHGCHYIDILLAWMGQPVLGTHIGTNFGTPWMEAEGTSNVTIKFKHGALGYHFGTWGAKGTRLKYSFHAHCTGGMLEGQISQGRLLFHRGAQEAETGREELLFETEPGKHVQNELMHFVECLESGRRPLTDGVRSLQSLRVIWKLYEAEKRGVMADLRGLGIDRIS
ncbi:Gfo/Idh/MocA family oxidoreductase [Chloroflexi bacterium TSY]|nr:Gfo/Idh/MocA family oxidoreductase [Chloroflexi bacterium TSY]